MLGKLIKYDFKQSCRLLLPILGGVLALSVIGKLLLITRIYDLLPDVFKVLSVLAYGLIIFACFIGAPIYFVVYFYKNFYSNTGYLMHTLPVTTHQKLVSKIVTTFVLELLTFFVCALSIVILIYQKGMFKTLTQGWHTANIHFQSMLDMSLTTFIILTLIMMIVSIFVQMILFFACVSIGQIFSGHKVLGSIAAYLMIHFVVQMISTVLLVLVGFPGIQMDAQIVMSGQVILAVYGITGCLTLLEGVALYVVCYFFMEKKLNLS